MSANPEVLDPSGDVIGRRPLDTAELLELLEALSLDEPNLAAVLDHLTVQVDHVVQFVDALAPMLVGFSEMSEQIASGGVVGLLGALSGR